MTTTITIILLLAVTLSTAFLLFGIKKIRGKTENDRGADIITKRQIDAEDFKDVLDSFSQCIANAIDKNPNSDEAETDGLYITFDDTLTVETETVYTGVEYLGYRERYTVQKKTLTSLKITGVYDEKGEMLELTNQLDTKKLLEKINVLLQP